MRPMLNCQTIRAELLRESCSSLVSNLLPECREARVIVLDTGHSRLSASPDKVGDGCSVPMGRQNCWRDGDVHKGSQRWRDTVSAVTLDSVKKRARIEPRAALSEICTSQRRTSSAAPSAAPTAPRLPTGESFWERPPQSASTRMQEAFFRGRSCPTQCSGLLTIRVLLGSLTHSYTTA